MNLVSNWLLMVMVASSSVQPRLESHPPRSHRRLLQHSLAPTRHPAPTAHKEYTAGDVLLHVLKLENALRGASKLEKVLLGASKMEDVLPDASKLENVLPEAPNQEEARHLALLNTSIMSVDGFPRREPSSHYPDKGPLPQHRTKRGCGVLIRGPFYPYYTSRDSPRQASSNITCCVLSPTLLLLTCVLAGSCWWW
ncbi:uncharacterized protein [Procambarus clarkii]|uniref:uncharacterized protein isoform X1 n=1 Tax=Procambarus clarkii TaxID=6728 RepID=UPI003742F475